MAAARHGQGPAVFDASGLRAMLAEWYATDSARRSVSSLLEPLERLDDRRADEAIQTLQLFLEEQGSVTRTLRSACTCTATPSRTGSRGSRTARGRSR